MDWLERMNRSMNYIEQNLSNEIDAKRSSEVSLLFRVSFS